MKYLVFFFAIVILVPGDLFAQMIANQSGSKYYSADDALFYSLTTGGKKKKQDKKSGKDKTVAKKSKESTDYNWNFFAGPDLAFGFPLGKIRDSVDNGTGFNIRAEYFYSSNLNFGIWTGFKSFKYDQVMVGKGHFSYIPVKLTGTYYFNNGNIRPYANFGLGAYLLKQKYDAEFWTLVRNPETNRLDTLYEKKHLNENSTKFGFSPSVGVLYNIQDQYFVNFNLSYEMILTENKSSNFVGINIGFLYKFGF
ncbi:MAG: outer membrane beta-barrel protein [Bacteroidales bacterium]